jgi:hypothetical protein
MPSRRAALRRRSPPSPFSPLYCRLNGFSLGAFLAGAQLDVARPRYSALRQRMQEFLQEIGADEHLPSSHARYIANYPQIAERVFALVHARSRDLYEFTGIGAMAALHAGGASLVTSALRVTLRKRWTPVFDRHGVPAHVYDTFVRSLRRDARSLDAARLLSHAFALLPELLHPLPAEADTAFVAMPFRPRFIRYFREYYGPALRRAGYRALRCWGGITSEEYYPFIAPLIVRCGAVLAELSTRNPNVLNEIGLAHGCNRPVVMVQELRQPDPPSNLADLSILRYDEQHWSGPQHDVARLARFVTLHRDAFEASLTRDAVISVTARQLMLYLEAAGRPVPAQLAELIAPAANSVRRRGATQSGRSPGVGS